MDVVLATNNKNKLREMRALLSDMGINVLSLSDIGFFDDIVEDGDSFEANARIKARAVSSLGHIAIADDSGLCVDVLDGAPGIFSARYAGEPCDDEANNRKLLAEIDGVADDKRTAKFVSTIVMSFPDGRELVSTGETDGVILREYRGNGGFGYDPLFLINDANKTFAELTDEEKNGVSHRGKAMRGLKAKLARLPEKRDTFTLGIYGGTFSPPHKGHLNAVNAMLDECDIDALLVIPSL